MLNKKHNFLIEHVETRKGTRFDYELLGQYHYQRILEGPVTQVFKIVGSGPYYYKYPDPLSVLVLMQPVPDIQNRNFATHNFFHQPTSRSNQLKLLNQKVLYLARLITDPRFLRRGLATKLLNDTLSLVDIPIIETMTPIDFTNRMYVNAGFKLYPMYEPLWWKHLRNSFAKVGIILHETLNPILLTQRLDALTGQDKIDIEHTIATFLSKYRNASHFACGLKRSQFILSKVPPPQAYLIWFNPRNDYLSQNLKIDSS